jgi:uncharacterized protein YbjT (DUF2867 family)
MSTKNLLITGATGKQGGAVIDAIMADKQHASQFTIYGVTRNVESASATKLVAKYPSVKLVAGDMNDCPGIFAQAKVPIWGVFSVQIPMGKGANVETEEKQGKDLVDAAIANGVSHFIQTSVDRHGERSSENPTNVPHFISKHRIEKHLEENAKGTNMTYTILRPVFFMENLANNFQGKLVSTTWWVALGPDTKLQMVSLQDIGFFAAQAFINPTAPEYKNRGIGLAGDELSYNEADKLFREKAGYPIPTTFSIFGYLFLWAVKEIGLMFTFFKEQGYAADIPALKKMNPNLITLSKRLDMQKEKKYN